MSISSLGTKGQSMDEGGSVGTLKEWRRLYETEKANYDSVAVYAEVRLVHVIYAFIRVYGVLLVVWSAYDPECSCQRTCL